MTTNEAAVSLRGVPGPRLDEQIGNRNASSSTRSPRRRIAVFFGTGIFAGKEIMTLELVQGLREHGCEVEMIGSFWGLKSLAKRLMELGFSVHRVWLGFISATLRVDCLYMTAAQLLRWPQLLI